VLNRDVAEIRFDLRGLDAVADVSDDPTTAFLRGRASTIAGGTTEVMKNILAERNLGLSRETALTAPQPDGVRGRPVPSRRRRLP